MKKERLERYYPVSNVRIEEIFYAGDEGDYIQEIDVLIERLNNLKKQGCTHTYNSLDIGFKYLTRKESLAKKIEAEHKVHVERLKELEDEYNNLD